MNDDEFDLNELLNEMEDSMWIQKKTPVAVRKAQPLRPPPVVPPVVEADPPLEAPTRTLYVEEKHLGLLPREVVMTMFQNRLDFPGGYDFSKVITTCEEACTNLFCAAEDVNGFDEVSWVAFSTPEDLTKFQLAYKF